MKKEEFEQKLNDFSMKLISYEDGEILLLCDLTDEIENLKNDIKCGYIVKIFEIIGNILLFLIKNNKTDHVINRISVGIDLISSIIKQNNNDDTDNFKIKDDTIEDVEQYLDFNIEYCSKENDIVVKAHHQQTANIS